MKKLIIESHKGFALAIVLSAICYVFLQLIKWDIVSLKAIIIFFLIDYALCWIVMIVAWFVIFRKEKK
jgi:cation transporter-like permease